MVSPDDFTVNGLSLFGLGASEDERLLSQQSARFDHSSGIGR